MKTSELKKWLEDNDWLFIETSSYIEILDLIKVYTTTQTVTFENFSYGSERSFSLLNIIVEYCSTPLNEREDEKKYRIRINNTLSKEDDYLTLILNQNKYYFSIFNANSEVYQRIFTQSEIDNFPAEIKRAIECGFLRKVEVE